MSRKLEEKICENFALLGDDESFDVLYKTYYTRVYYFVYKHCNNEELAREVTQITFIEVYKSRKNLRNHQSFYSWMLGIAYRQMLKVLDKEKKHNIYSYEYDIENGIIDLDNNVLQQVDHRVMIDIIDQTIATMRPIYKEIAILLYHHEHTNKEIAETLSLNAGVVKVRVHRINKMIREQLEIAGLSPQTQKVSATSAFLVTSLVGKTIHSRFLSEPFAKIDGTISTLIGSGATSKVAVFSLLGSLTLGSVYYVEHKEQNISAISMLSNDAYSTIEECRITSVTYDENYTQNPVQLLVETTSQEYDTITINNLETDTIYVNGTYEVSIKKENTILDSTVIHVSNIDIEAPILLDDWQEEEMYYLKIAEDVSGMNKESIKYYINDGESKNYEYNSQNQIISFPITENTKNYFYMEDNANNWIKIRINYE
jgi:RNA polymerase sigma-70 factor (ECF subfamily)